MSETLTGKDKIQQICDAIKTETIQPAQQEAHEIIENAHSEAKEILKEAQESAKKALQEAEKEIHQKKKVFESSLSLSVKQVIDSLKQTLEQELLMGSLHPMLKEQLTDAKVCARIIEAVSEGIEKEGFDADLELYLPQSISREELMSFLKEKIQSRLSKKSIQPHHLSGVTIKLKGKNIILDFSDQTLRELLSRYVRKDFHQWIFKNKGQK